MKVLLLARYGRLGASSRLRCFQYLPYLESNDISVDSAPLFDDGYIQSLMRSGNRSLAAVMKAYWKRFWQLRNMESYDLIWVEYEALPWLPFWMENFFLNECIPYIVEYDDAIFHRYDLKDQPLVRRLLRDKIPALMRQARSVIAGNDYIAVRAEVAGARNIVQIPTAVDLDRYMPLDMGNSIFTVGWIGSPITAPYLELIRPSMERLAATGPLKLVVIGADAPQWQGVEAISVPWSEDSEVSQINQFDVGVMPLPDEPWERGKCGYKLIQYMACAKAVVASPVGANAVIVESGTEGFLATNLDEWFAALQQLREDKSLRVTMGRAGRAKVESQYCTAVTAPRLLAALREAAVR